MERFRRFRQTGWWRLLVRPLLFLALSIVVARILINLVGAVDWRQVAEALGRLEWTAVPLLLLLLLVRQSFNSVPLAVFVPGLGFPRAFQNDLTANLVGTVAPPPGDVVVRISMFRSWGISAVDGMPGVTLNSLTFYVIRFTVPILGIVVLLGQELTGAKVWSAVVSLLIALAIVVALVLVARGERFARLLGVWAARVASRFRDGVDEHEWGERVASFRATMSTRLSRGLPPALLSLAAMVVTDGAIVLTSLRLVGVDDLLLPFVVVMGTFLAFYPVTALPLAGLGVLDAALVVAYTETAGVAAEPDIVAALVVWRVVTILGTLGLGLMSFLWWRWQMARGRILQVDGKDLRADV